MPFTIGIVTKRFAFLESSHFMLTFAMSLMILLVFKCSTKVSEKSDMAKFWAIFCCPETYKDS